MLWNGDGEGNNKLTAEQKKSRAKFNKKSKNLLAELTLYKIEIQMY